MSRSLDVLGAAGWGEVDAQGGISPSHAKWRLDWLVRSAKQWHKASDTKEVRQTQLGAGAVIETRMKLPEGDATQRVWAVAASSESAVAVVEVANQAATAFAFAIVLESAGANIAVKHTGVWVDRELVLASDRPAAVFAVGEKALVELLQADVPADSTATLGDGTLGGGNQAHQAKGRDVVALVWPLPHTGSLAVSVGLAPGRVPLPCDLPDAQAVIRGWDAHLDRGARIEVPDEGLARRIRQNRRRWLGLTGRMETAEVKDLCLLAVRLDHHGYHNDAELVLDEIAARWTTEAPAERLVAVTTHHDLTGDQNVAKRYTTAVAEAVAAAARTGIAAPVGAVQRLLRAAGETKAAVDVTHLALSEMEPTFAGLRAELVDDSGIELLVAPGFRSGWRGGSMAVYGLPTRWGLLSYAVRWHGERPALLWELDLRAGVKMPTLNAPALDEAWSSTEIRGEALLRASV